MILMSEDAVWFTLLNKSDWFELLCQAHDFVLFQACSAYLPFFSHHLPAVMEGFIIKTGGTSLHSVVRCQRCLFGKIKGIV